MLCVRAEIFLLCSGEGGRNLEEVGVCGGINGWGDFLERGEDVVHESAAAGPALQQGEFFWVAHGLPCLDDPDSKSFTKEGGELWRCCKILEGVLGRVVAVVWVVEGFGHVVGDGERPLGSDFLFDDVREGGEGVHNVRVAI